MKFSTNIFIYEQEENFNKLLVRKKKKEPINDEKIIADIISKIQPKFRTAKNIADKLTNSNIYATAKYNDYTKNARKAIIIIAKNNRVELKIFNLYQVHQLTFEGDFLQLLRAIKNNE